MTRKSSDRSLLPSTRVTISSTPGQILSPAGSAPESNISSLTNTKPFCFYTNVLISFRTIQFMSNIGSSKVVLKPRQAQYKFVLTLIPLKGIASMYPNHIYTQTKWQPKRGQSFTEGYDPAAYLMFWAQNNVCRRNPDLAVLLNDKAQRGEYSDQTWVEFCGKSADQIWELVPKSNVLKRPRRPQLVYRPRTEAPQASLPPSSPSPHPEEATLPKEIWKLVPTSNVLKRPRRPHLIQWSL